MLLSEYRRAKVEGGTYFFTHVAHGRARLFDGDFARRLLGEKLRACQAERPFQINAIVLLPEHLHAIWTLPSGDADYSGHWAWIKKE
jgi:putative transposase